MKEQIRAYLFNHFGPDWEKKMDDTEQREFIVEALYVNRVLSLRGLFDLGWVLGYSKADQKRKREDEIYPHT